MRTYSSPTRSASVASAATWARCAPASLWRLVGKHAVEAGKQQCLPEHGDLRQEEGRKGRQADPGSPAELRALGDLLQGCAGKGVEAPR